MNSLDTCVFCDIFQNIDSYKSKDFFLESEFTFAIPDKYPATKGHTLIISKDHYKNLMVTDDHVLSDAIKLAKKTAEKLLTTHKDIKGFNYVSNQNKEAKQIIFHLHLHVIPRY